MLPETGCLICGKELIYSENFTEIKCDICGQNFEANVRCSQGHYICDNCHSLDAMDYIEKFCDASDDTDPIRMATTVMKNNAIKMHGPEHHFLVPAVMLSAYYNKTNGSKIKSSKIATARKRAEIVPGGFCGFYGNCGAGVGTGIFISLITDATPLSKKEWKLANLMTSKSLLSIAEHGGPRCCKRDTYLSIIESVKFIKEQFNVDLDMTGVSCGFHGANKECLSKECVFFK
jgi:hypothetical protein